MSTPSSVERAWRAHTGQMAWPTVGLMLSILAGEVLVWAGVLGGGLPIGWGVVFASLLAYASFTVMHDASHGSIAGSQARYRGLEQALGWVAGSLLWAPFGIFQVLHLRHHAHTNDPEQDPDHWVVGGSALSVALRCATIIPHYYWDFLFGESSRSAAGRRERGRTFAGVALYALVLAALGAAGLLREGLLLWVVPAWVASALLAFAFDWLPHHPHSLQERYRDTRVLLVPGLTIPLLWQNYHLIHHLWPRVPFYRYARVFTDVRGFLEHRGAPIEGLGGALPAPLGSALHTPADGPFPIRLVGVEHLTDDSVTLHIERTDGAPLRFLAGQFLTLEVPVGTGAPLRRCYSLCTAPGQGPHTLTIRRVPGGRVSGWLHAHARPGLELRAWPAAGQFLFDPADAPRELVLIGGGSGITPLLSMIRCALRDTRTRLTLLLGNRDHDHILFRDTLARLVAGNALHDRLRVLHVLEQPHPTHHGPIGRLDAPTLARLLRDAGLHDGPGVRYAICGPAPMMEGAQRHLLDTGVSADRIALERFTPADAAPVDGLPDGGPADDPAGDRGGEPVPVLFQIGVRQHTLPVAPGQTFLAAARAAELPLAWACGVGNCGTCRMQLIEGSVAQPQAEALLEDERAQGWFLACQARPTSACTIRQA